MRRAKRRRKGKAIRYLLYLALVTSVVTSVTLARYSSGAAGEATAMVAAFVAGDTLDLDVPLREQLKPGDTQTVDFTVTNFDGSLDNNLVLEYEIRVETTGNLPLEFTLAGEKANEDGSADTEEKYSRLAVPAEGKPLVWNGGRLPGVMSSGRKIHSYRLSIHWRDAESDEQYSDEIDKVGVKIITKQINMMEANP